MAHHPADASAPHLSADEIELWAEGLLPGARVMHLADCRDCLTVAEAERALLIALAQVPRLAPSQGFTDRVLARIRIPAPSERVSG